MKARGKKRDEKRTPEVRRAYAQAAREKLNDGYIKFTIVQRTRGLRTEDVTPEMVELKRGILLLKRLMKEMQDGQG